MMISENSQLGLRIYRPHEAVKYLELTLNDIKTHLAFREGQINRLEALKDDEETANELVQKFVIEDKEWLEKSFYEPSDRALDNEIHEAIPADIVAPTPNNAKGTKFFLICESVFEAARLIKVGEDFSGSIFNKIKEGAYTYLLGRDQMVRFVCKGDYIRGFIYNEKTSVNIPFGLNTETGAASFATRGLKDIQDIFRVMIFVELGDIEVSVIAGGCGNGAKNKDEKIHNSSRNTVYVVDSSWNKIIIRTTGFAVRGHFKLQPCGAGNKDRKLIWVNAFEKNGYTRRPRAEIVK